MNEELVDVIAVSYDDKRVLWVMENKTPVNAEACINMAIYRQGVEDRYFTTATPAPERSFPCPGCDAEVRS